MNIKNFLRKHFFYRQHPEAALRYLPIVDLLKEQKLENSKILEVGSGSYGIAPYLKREVVGVDTDFDEPEYPQLMQIKASAVHLPFADKEFDVAVFSDVLEHLPESQRQKALEEAIRVTKKMMIISGPFGQEAAKQDQELANYALEKTGEMHPYFQDHLKFGLPGVEDIKKYLGGNRRVSEIQLAGEFLNLGVRHWLMKSFITKNKLLFYFYLKGLMPIVPIIRLMNWRPCYRKVIMVRVES